MPARDLFLSKALFSLFLLSACAVVTSAQSQTGSISGTVTDANGAPVPGVSVVARQAATDLSIDTVTSESGLYVFPNVPVGVWTISAEKGGFKRIVKEGVQIFIAQRQTLDLQLEVGDLKQTVQVVADQTLLDAETSEKGQTLTPRLYQTLPLWTGGLQNPSAFSKLYGGSQQRCRSKYCRLYRPRP